jgi:hypothetical protein
VLEPLFLGYKSLKVNIYITITHCLATEHRVTIYTVGKAFKNKAGLKKQYKEITFCVPKGADNLFWLFSPHFLYNKNY